MSFKNKQQLSPREKWVGRHNVGRGTLITIFLFTVVNIFTTLFSEDGTYFVFSAAIPRFMIFIGMLICGKYEGIDYTEIYGDGFVPVGDTALIVLVVFATIISALYLVCWFLSARGRKVGLIIGIALFVIDTVSLPLLFDFSSIIVDLALHIVAVVYMALGLIAINKLRNMPIEQPVEQTEEIRNEQ